MKFRYPILLVIIIHVFVSIGGSAQDPKQYKKLFQNAEIAFQYEDYLTAVAIYEQILHIDSTNSNAHFLAGYSYLKAMCCRRKAIEHLEKAVKNINENYREGLFRERKAPVLAYFLLGRSYQKDYRFEEAVETYKKYRNYLDFLTFAEIEYVNRQILSCEKAEEMIKSPVPVNFISLADITDEKNPCYNPIISGNDSIMVFVSQKDIGNVIMKVVKKDSTWTKPVVIDFEPVYPNEFYPVSISYDGKELFLVYKEYLNSDIYVSRYDGFTYTKPVPLSDNINTKYSESHASISADGKTLYFTSNRKGGWGGMDIYKSERNPDGSWRDPVNLGFGINTYYNEETPFISQHDSVLYFSSEGLETMGGYDIFLTRIDKDGDFTAPQNLGYPISTPDDDLFYNPGWEGTKSYYARRPESDLRNSIIYAVIKDNPDDNPDDISENTVVDTKSGSKQAIDNFYYILNRIFFGFNEYTLSNEAKEDAERIYAMLKKNPLVEIELIGHADSRGRTEYNKRLSLRRAESVRNFLVQKGIASERIRVVAVGEDNPLAINNYDDGADAPEGRSLNRNVAIRIKNSDNTKIRMAEIFVPPRLIPIQDRVYTVLLEESEQLIDTIPEELYGYTISLIFTDRSKMYCMGSFDNLDLAKKKLNEVIDNGYPDAQIIEKSNFERTIRRKTLGDQTESLHYAIQLFALKNPIDLSYIALLDSVRMFVNEEGYRRYLYGNFDNINSAQKALDRVKQIPPYSSAFIRPVSVNFGYPDETVMEVRKSKTSVEEKEKPKPINTKDEEEAITETADTVYYGIQILATKNPVDIDQIWEKKPLRIFEGQDGYYRYVYGEFPDRNNAVEALMEIKKTEMFNGAFIRPVSIKNESLYFATGIPVKQDNTDDKHSSNGKVDNQHYTIQILATRNAVDIAQIWKSDSIQTYTGEDGLYRYLYGDFQHREEAEKKLVKVKKLENFGTAFIRTLPKKTESQGSNTIINNNSDYKDTVSGISQEEDSVLYAIQILAIKNPVEISQVWKRDSVRIYIGSDGLFRYVYGDFRGRKEAEKALTKVRSNEMFEAAFIRPVSYFDDDSEK